MSYGNLAPKTPFFNFKFHVNFMCYNSFMVGPMFRNKKLIKISPCEIKLREIRKRNENITQNTLKNGHFLFLPTNISKTIKDTKILFTVSCSAPKNL